MHPRALALVSALALSCAPEKPDDGALAREDLLRIGSVMMETGRRFELAGRASESRRWELAEYEVHEILEVFDGDMPRALLPDECDDAIADRVFEALDREQLPDLRQAAHERDAQLFRERYARAAASCNGCHAACDVAFVEVPAEPGRPVPTVDPIAPAGLPEPAPAHTVGARSEEVP